MEPRSIAVIGLGLIGGSLARDAAVLGIRVSAYDTNASALRAALREGVVTTALDASLAGVEDADVVVLAVPVTAAIETLGAAAGRLRRARCITDVCSTKRSMVEAARRLGLGSRFIGGHPLAGDHRAGWDAARAGLFHGVPVYLCPADDDAVAVAEPVERLWRAVGGVTEMMDAIEHDRLLASTSHLPQVVSTALARSILAAGIGLDQLGPGGRDMTRLARSAADVWTPIAFHNAAFLDAALARMEAELARLRRALAQADAEAVRHFFQPDLEHCGSDARKAASGAASAKSPPRTGTEGEVPNL
ncbi:MAG TPA: prephenate dehydrogenase/arogenate dehydrogenase family protein [Longimicrobiales bacterium]